MNITKSILKKNMYSKLILLSTLLCLIQCFNYSTLLASIEKINLEIGESKILKIQDGIRVSKKGIIDISEENNSYNITGMKEGIVMISEESQPNQKYLISVSKNKNKSTSKPVSNLSTKSSKNLEDLCKYYKFQYDRKSVSVSGSTSDPTVWKTLRQACLEENCYFNIKLDDRSFKQIISYLQNILPKNFKVSYRDQNIFVTTPCKSDNKKFDQEFINYLTEGFIQKQHIPIVCEEDPSQYLIKAYIVAFQESLFTEYDLSFDNLINENFDIFRKFLRSASIHKKAQVIAEPSLYLTPNTKTKIHSGGELKYSSRQDNTVVDTWKKTGIELEFDLLSRTDEGVKLFIDMNLITDDSSQPSKDKLSSNSISSLVNIPLETVTLVGTTDVMLNSSTSKTSSFIHKLPIIKTLFSDQEKSLIKNKLFLWISIEEKNSNSQDLIVDVIN